MRDREKERVRERAREREEIERESVCCCRRKNERSLERGTQQSTIKRVRVCERRDDGGKTQLIIERIGGERERVEGNIADKSDEK